MRYVLFIFLLLLVAVLMLKLINDPETDIKMLKEASKAQFPNHPIVASLTVAQALLESDLDDSNKNKKVSLLALKYNNLFGIKWPQQADTRKVAAKFGKPIELVTKEESKKGKIITIKDKFIWFNSIEDCLKYREYMLKWNRYKGVFKAESLKEAAEIMQKGGYATDSKYVNKLLNRYKQWDK